MNFETYEREGHYAYAKLAETIANILSVIVRNVPNLRVQQIQHRAKRPSSLRTKLEQRRNLECACIEDEVKDLAGCRIVLYTNSDVTRFLSSGAIQENFNVDWERT
jgi:ppGpp synthetase/RelA/SpoT-type nucleotidyltranferase